MSFKSARPSTKPAGRSLHLGLAEAPRRTKADLFAEARAHTAAGSFALEEWRAGLPERARTALEEISEQLTPAADAADAKAGETDSFPGFAPTAEEAA